MSLHAVRQNADLALTWNRESALIANATSGALSIKDGESTRVVPFDPARLRDGSILYSPKTDQILMQLTVSTATDSYTESVTVILPTGKEARTEPALPPRTFIPAATPPSPLPDTVVKLMKPFIAPALPERALQSLPSLQDPPSVNDRPTSPMALPSALTLIPGSVERPTATPSPAHTPPSSAPAMTSSYEPAIPIVKIQPRVPPELRPLLFKKLTVEVRVSIGKTGKVLHAEAVPLKNVNQMLLNSAVDASLSWKFRPAMLNHEAVASESILQFVFNP
jgi:hypothetical protein